jgi:regulator of sirC expression with transglutaminase-like and TPR domain
MEGRVFTHPRAARTRFLEIVAQPEETLDLGEAALVIALEQEPSLSVADYLDLLERWAACARSRAGGSADSERMIAEVNRLLFEDEGFHPSDIDWYDPRTALLNEVLDRHEGFPLALSLVYIEVSRRAGLQAAGVALPGRFLVKVVGPTGEILIDPWDGGRALTRVECQAILDQVYGGAVMLREHHLRSCEKRQVLARLLAHLKSSYRSRGDLQAAASAADRLLVLDENDPYELRDRAVMAMELHRYDEAIRCLERYLAAMPSAEDRGRVRDEIDWLRAWTSVN